MVLIISEQIFPIRRIFSSIFRFNPSMFPFLRKRIEAGGKPKKLQDPRDVQGTVASKSMRTDSTSKYSNEYYQTIFHRVSKEGHTVTVPCMAQRGTVPPRP